MNFEINQKVICVDNRHSTNCSHPLVKGKIYTVYGFYTCACGSEQIYVNEVPAVVFIECKCGRISERQHSYYAWRFRALQHYNLFQELLEEKVEQGEKSDLPKLQPEIITENK